MPALYNINDPRQGAERNMSGAINTFSRKQLNQEKKKTAGGAINSGIGGASAGAAITGTPYGAAIGFVGGVAMYYMG